MSPPLIPPLIISLLLALLHPFSAAAAAAPVKALVTPITKHTSTSLFTFPLHTNPNRSFLLDLSSPVSLLRCPSSTAGHPAATTLSLPSTDGHTPLSLTTIENITMRCAPASSFLSLPPSTAGIAALSQAPFSIPSQLASSSYHLSKQFAICLPSLDSSPGVAFFGSGPFFLLPPPGRNISALLQFTPLIKPPVKSDFGYYISLKGISINLQAVNIPANLLGFDSSGHGGVKLSTVVPYTTLRTPIYRAFVSHYARATSGVQRVKSVAPFELCLNATQLGSTRVGPAVPQVDLQLSSGGNWTMFGTNTFKQVSDDVACLAFLDGGEKAANAAVIGSFQIEHNFLQFDLEKSVLGFSSLLFFFQTTCSNFNFTSGV